jgi:transcription antitermination factor NusA-like protein
MQDMRYLNLFSKITRINTRFCIKYNEMLIFCVPKDFVMRAVGEDARNIRIMSETIGKKIRIIPCPRGLFDARQFIENIVKPVTFKDLEIRGNEIILTAGNQSKAALIGRNKRRLLEMQKIVKDYFGKEFRII